MLRAWRRRATLRDRGRRDQWLAAIVRNEAFRIHARVRPNATDALEAEEGAEDQRVVATVESADVRAALGRLSRGDRRLLAMRYQLDLTQAEIARQLGVPEGTAKVWLYRARSRLRRIYAPQ